MCIESVILLNHLILSHPLLLLLSIFPSIRVFPMSQSFELGGQCTGISASASVLPMNTQDRFPLGLMGLASLQSKGLLESSPTPQFKSTHSSALSFLYSPTLTFIHDGKTIALIRWTLDGKVMSLLFNMLSRLVQRRQWHPTPVLLTGKSHGWRSLVSCGPWGR